MWRGIKCITDYKTRDAQCSKDPSLPEALNKFYARFEDPDTPPSIRLTPTPGEVPLSVTPAEVRRTLRRINPRKSAGPDNIPGRVLRECADQISEVLADIFNVSLTQAAVPTCLKTATIIPVPKSSTVTGLNDYRPIALTPIVTKCFERLVMTHIKATIDVTVDPHQYAYRKNRSTDDAISSVVHTALTHLEQKDSYVRMLFVDFTSAFNTMIPQTLTDKLSSLGLRSSLCNWVLDFLTNRPQSVRIHNLSSSTTILSTGSPQGCVLSPLLFTLLTYDCSPIHPGCHIVKFADDTAVVGCITNSDESGYRQEVEHLEGWCRKNNLCINIKKTKEMIVDFRRGRHAHLPLHVGGSAVEVVSSYRYLGVHLSNNLTWSNNTSSLVRKGTPAALLPQAVEASWARELGPHLLLQMCGGERSMLQHQRVARKLLCCRQESSAEGGEGCTEVCRSQPPHHHGHLHLQMQEEGHLHHEGPHSPSTLTVCPAPLRQEAAEH
ncbi:hypothetical protein NFI96_005743 [Prochilodus magdalenae]|nr:hypothetical protein NFI96_005743 [Prochilodus magdalenae]